MQPRNIDRITIVGGGTTGYLTAFHMAKTYPSKTITWYFPEENDIIGVGEALVPAVSKFLANLGITHRDVITHCNGTMKLGIKFENFNGTDDEFVFPFGSNSKSYNTASVDFMINQDKLPEHLLEYPSQLSVHMQATEILKFMDTKINDYPNLVVKRDAITEESIAGTWDLLIDCTGFRQSVSARPGNYKSIGDTIPNNRALVYRHEYTNKPEQMKPYTCIHATDYGWIWRIPLGNKLAFGYVHDGKYDVKQEFVGYVEKFMGIELDPNLVRTVNMRTGRNIVHLKDNIVPVGLASSFIEPLESTGLWLVTSAVERLCEYIDGAIDEDEYNNLTNKDIDVIIDFIVAHYKYSKRDSEYWNHYRDIEIQTHVKINIFNEDSWDYILSGFDENIKRPKEAVNIDEFIKIGKGIPYHKWHEKIINEKDSTHLPK